MIKNLMNNNIFKLSLIVGAVFVLAYLSIVMQEEKIDKACLLISQNENELAKKEIEGIVSIDRYGTLNETVLMSACKSGNAEMISYLIENDADPNITVPGGLYPLELLCNFGYKAGVDSMLLLIQNGASQSNYNQRPPVFHLAYQLENIDAKYKDSVSQMIFELLQLEAPLRNEETTILHLAAKNNAVWLFDKLVHTTQGIGLLAVEDINGNTPWKLSVKHGAIDIQHIIRGLEMELQTESETPELN